jgi:hypothetical protein
VSRHRLSTVIAGLDPAIHEEVRRAMMLISLSAGRLIMDARVKPAHDTEIFAKAM